ncbi:23S rRNA U2552 (ribose-2'-O)-methylase RlmE/FtsJ [Rhizomicrobium palustre]|uniref:23S rRNA U2552 (Ribose-2'-O)-methylase RlmE/FtsJ n=1 Tax=Rhizomicrobium palustre TaxID=189966 RepID=A0A846MW13_9PROT|nr:hypothetical protein [Rhizomicrobium palustre]NIK87415.1 23S rRNA U2552 (ribose-2'-O)-methylase RlmE/FtsJ [Rhizomicrobium palustre]
MKPLVSRRNLIVGAGGVVVLGAAGVGASKFLRKRYAPSPYDDLLVALNDRDGAAQIGEAVLAVKPDFEATAVAAALRTKLQHSTFADLAAKDAASGKLVEARGWVLPESFGLLCALAAKAAA